MIQDLRYALRNLLKTPSFFIVATIVLALGIGANTAIFSVVNGVVLQPLPYENPERIYAISETSRTTSRTFNVSALDFIDWKNQQTVFVYIAGYIGRGFIFTDREPEQVLGEMVSAELFSVLGVKPLLGRTLLPEENEIGRDQVMVLSYGLWQRKFGGDPNVIGRVVPVNSKGYTIVGVMPKNFEFPASRYELWVPFPFIGSTDGLLSRESHFLRVIGRLKPGRTPEQAKAEMDTIARRLEQLYPKTNENIGAGITSLTEQVVGDVRLAMLVLLGAVTFVLLIACSNVANLLLSRSSARRREIAIRGAIGASRIRLLRQLLTESLVLASIGGCAGLLFAAWGVDLLRSSGVSTIPRLHQIQLDGSVLAFTLLVSLGSGIAFGLAPALQHSRDDLFDLLKGGRSVKGHTSHRLRRAMLVSQVALALVLLVGSGLAMKSFFRLQHVDPGFDTENTLTASFALQSARYPEAQHMLAFYRELLDRFSAQPTIEAAGLTTHLPFTGQDLENGLTIEGRPAPKAGEGQIGYVPSFAGLHSVSPGYFRALGTPLRRGRYFDDRDTTTATKVLLINETMARRFFPNEDPLGKRLKLGGYNSPSPWREIVGIVGDVHHLSLDREPKPEIFTPYPQMEPAFMKQWSRGLSLVVRSTADPGALASIVKSEIHALDKEMPVQDLQTMSNLVANSLGENRFRTFLLTLFAVLALTLAVVGLYGVISYSVAQRTQEIGVRMALGASQSDVFKQVIGEGMLLTLIGEGIGLVAAFFATRFMSSLLYNVKPTDAATFAGITIILTLTAALACYIPAWRATRIDPMVALRDE